MDQCSALLSQRSSLIRPNLVIDTCLPESPEPSSGTGDRTSSSSTAVSSSLPASSRSPSHAHQPSATSQPRPKPLHVPSFPPTPSSGHSPGRGSHPAPSALARGRLSSSDLLLLLSPSVASSANLGSAARGPYACKTCNAKFPSLHALGYHQSHHAKPSAAAAGHDSSPAASVKDQEPCSAAAGSAAAASVGGRGSRAASRKRSGGAASSAVAASAGTNEQAKPRAPKRAKAQKCSGEVVSLPQGADGVASKCGAPQAPLLSQQVGLFAQRREREAVVLHRASAPNTSTATATGLRVPFRLPAPLVLQNVGSAADVAQADVANLESKPRMSPPSVAVSDVTADVGKDGGSGSGPTTPMATGLPSVRSDPRQQANKALLPPQSAAQEALLQQLMHHLQEMQQQKHQQLQRPSSPQQQCPPAWSASQQRGSAAEQCCNMQCLQRGVGTCLSRSALLSSIVSALTCGVSGAMQQSRAGPSPAVQSNAGQAAAGFTMSGVDLRTSSQAMDRVWRAGEAGPQQPQQLLQQQQQQQQQHHYQQQQQQLSQHQYQQHWHQASSAPAGRMNQGHTPTPETGAPPVTLPSLVQAAEHASVSLGLSLSPVKPTGPLRGVPASGVALTEDLDLDLHL